MHWHTTRLVTILALAAVAGACGRSDEQAGTDADAPPASAPAVSPDSIGAADGGPVPVDTSSAGAAPAPAPGTDAAEPATAEQGTWTAGAVRVRHEVGGVAVLRDVRTARHDGWDRIVLEWEGSMPGYHIEYVDRPVRQCGSGNVVEVSGDGWLSILVEPADAHTEEGRPTVSNRNRQLQLPNLRQLVLTCDFEAQVVWVAGVGSPNPFRITELGNPARLVVDIRHRAR